MNKNTGNPLVSIIVPIYNIDKYLNRCLDSLISQTYDNIEIILVDDGSTDNCGAICDRYAESYTNISAYHKKNGGLSDARNYGICMSRGEYLSFVDSDDFVDPRFIEVLVRDIIATHADISAVDFEMVYDGQNLQMSSNNLIETYDKNSAIEGLFDDDKFQDYAWNKLYRRNLFDSVKYPEGFYMEDLGTTYLLLLQCTKVAFNRSKLYYYYQRNNSIANKRNIKLYEDKYILAMKRYEDLSEVYPEMYKNKLYIVHKIVECFPYLNKIKQNEARNVINLLWESTKKDMSTKRKIRFVLIKYFPALYTVAFKKV